jgi:toxin HigB-1
VIESFRCKRTEALFRDEEVLSFRAFERSARRKLLILHRAKSLGDLAALPGNRLEALKGDRAGQHSIRINDRWRICFVWRDGAAQRVEIVDYH